MYEEDSLYHHGILGQKWGIRRFQPYAKGSKGGKEVGEAAKKKSLSEKVGEKRLRNRLGVTASENDRYAAKAGIGNNLKSMHMETLNEQTKEILKDSNRVQRIGKGTIARRVSSVTAGSAVAAGAAFAAVAVEAPVIALAAPAALGAAALYYHKTTY